jgi:small-conductance mechanosensitive channel
MEPTAEQRAKDLIEGDSEVREAVAQAGGAAPPPAARTSSRDRAVMIAAAVVIAAMIACRLLLGLPLLQPIAESWPILQRIPLGLALAAAALLAERVVEVVLLHRIADPVARYDLERVLRLLLGLVAAGLVVTTVFANWRAAVASLGLLSLVLGFALQTPITSLLAWVYILVRRPYRVGDRIRMGEVTGDVIGIGYLDTTLWEFGGEYLSTDHPSGRLIKFPNANVLQTPVWNYSWPAFPFVWNEIKFQVGYDSDLDFVGRVMQETAQEHIGKAMEANVRAYRAILARTPVDHLDVQERPSMAFRIGENTWVEAIVRYLVHPKEAGRVKTRLILELLKRLNEHPDKVRFPKGDMR